MVSNTPPHPFFPLTPPPPLYTYYVVTWGVGMIAELETMPLNISWSKFQKTTKNALNSFFLFNIRSWIEQLLMYVPSPSILISFLQTDNSKLLYEYVKVEKTSPTKPPCPQLLCKNKMQECLALRNSSLSWKYLTLVGNSE
jgi:hypothetical protein